MQIKKVLFIGNTAWSMYNFRRSLFSELINQNYRVFVVSPQDNYYQEKLNELGCCCITLDISSKGVNPVTDIKLFFDIRKVLKQTKPWMHFLVNIYTASSQLMILNYD